jgi:hypothetical protein
MSVAKPVEQQIFFRGGAESEIIVIGSGSGYVN